MLNAYDELPYRSMPIEWTEPERLALVSLLHGGPRVPPDPHGYRVLELGCACGANLLPMAFHRPQGRFVGIDSAASQIALANKRRAAEGIDNVEFLCADFQDAQRHVSGEFDYIIAHGVFSWISDAARDALLELCAARLSRNGLLYLNYNTLPGWNVRGMIRRLLLSRTRDIVGLQERALGAREIAAQLAESLRSGGHPYTQLLVRELEFVSENHYSWVAHEYLAEHNHAYWRSEFMQLARAHGFDYVADADFNYPTGRVCADTALLLQLDDSNTDDTSDLLCYRQLHSPILCRAHWTRRSPSVDELAQLRIASCLERCVDDAGRAHRFRHPSGYEVEAKEEGMRVALLRLQEEWPRSLPVGELFPEVARVAEDLRLLHRNGLIDIRYHTCEVAEAAHVP